MPYKLSVIIPFFNAARTLERSAESLFSQTLDEIEFVFLDDGSSDESVGILNSVISRFEARRGDVRVVTLEENLGQAHAREQGVRFASGKYVIHCDADDYVDPDMYKVMYEMAEAGGYDIVQCGYVIERDGRELSRWLFEESLFTHREKLISDLLLNKGLSSLCDKLVLRDLYSRVIFPQNDIYEDFATAVQLYHHCRSIAYVNEMYYHYCYYDDSSLHSLSEARVLKSCSDISANVAFICRFMQSVGLSRRYFRELEHLKFGAKNRWMWNRDYHSLQEWRATFPEVFPSVFLNPYVRFRSKVFALKLLILAPRFVASPSRTA